MKALKEYQVELIMKFLILARLMQVTGNLN